MSTKPAVPVTTTGGVWPTLAASPEAIVECALNDDRRVLLIGQPGTGKSTLVNALGRTLAATGRECWCIGADPGSPLFGVPGAVCLGRWQIDGWHLEALEAMCTLDAGRFRLPLVSAVGRLAEELDARGRTGTLLVDGPGVMRGIVGAELLTSLVETLEVDTVLVLNRSGRPMPLGAELSALDAVVYAIIAAPEAHRPGKRSRARERTALWDTYLAGAHEQTLALHALTLTGTPPPVDAPTAWVGRQVALLQGRHTHALGEVARADMGALRIRVSEPVATPVTLLVRDARRLPDGRLATAEPFAPEPLVYLPPPDMAAGEAPAGTTLINGPRVAGRVGNLSVSLVNGIFGDPLLHLRLRHRRRSLLFDLGEGARLPARVAHQVSDVFISHAHMDHIAGFLWLLRSRIGELPVCRLYGPPGLAGHIAGLMQGVLWDRIAGRAPAFEITELHATRMLRFFIRAGDNDARLVGERAVEDGILLAEPDFVVRAATLDHGTPVLAFAFEPAAQLNVRKDRLVARGLAPGPWLGELKGLLHTGQHDASLRLPDGTEETVDALADELVLVSPGKKLVYATDLADTTENRRRLIELAHNAHTLFCEAAFIEADADQAARTSHLTARACGEIAEDAAVARLVPFHFSRRYEHDARRVYAEVAANCPRVAIPPGYVLRNVGPGTR